MIAYAKWEGLAKLSPESHESSYAEDAWNAAIDAAQAKLVESGNGALAEVIAGLDTSRAGLMDALDLAIERLTPGLRACHYERAQIELREAREAFAELVEAAKHVRDNVRDDSPEMWERFDAAIAGVAGVEGGAA